MAKFGKSYQTKEEFEKRGINFKKALTEVMNEMSKNENTGFRLSLNKFADWDHEEYKSLLGFKKSEALRDGIGKKLPTDALPESIDWREQGAVNPV